MQNLKRDERWKDSKGNHIYVSDMSEEYAKNVLRMLLRKQREAKTEAASLFMFNSYCDQLANPGELNR